MYQALYRKYRSKTFDDLLGQDQVVIPLKNQITQEKMSHAYLFSGTRGTGKTSAAKILARAVNCLHPKDGNPCNQCENCKLILEDRMMDVVEMDAASNNGVDDIRDLKDRVVYPPSLGKYKVYIIDEVHMLSKGAFNALLKVLEEPPDHLIFILATTEIEKIPQTIQSRCQKFQFRRLSVETMARGMGEILKKEGISAQEEALTLLARHGQGSMRDSLSLLEQCLYLGPELSYEGVVQSLGLMETEEVQALLSSLLRPGDLSFIYQLHDYYEGGKELEGLLRDLIYALRGSLLAHEIKDPTGLLTKDQVQALAPFLDQVDSLLWVRAMESLQESLKNLRYQKDPLLSAEIALLDLNLIFQGQEGTWPKLEKNLEVLDQIGKKKGTLRSEKKELPEEKEKRIEEPAEDKLKEERPAPILKEKEGADLESPGKDGIIEKTESLDEDLVQEIQDYCKDQGNQAVAAILRDASFRRSQGRLSIVFQPGYDFHVKNLSREDNRALVKAGIGQVLGEDLDLEICLDKDRKQEHIQDLVDFFGQDLVERE